MKKISVLVIIYVSIMVIFYGFFSLIVKNLSHYISVLEERVEIVAFINDKLNDNQEKELIKKIENIKGIDKIKYTSKEAALDEFRKNSEFAKQIEILGENPLPATVDIYLTKKDPETVKQIAEEIKVMNGVEDIYYTSIEAENLLTINKTFASISDWFKLILILFIIISIIPLTFISICGNVFYGIIEGIVSGIIGFSVLHFMHRYVFVLNFKTPVFFSKSGVLISFIVLIILCILIRVPRYVKDKY